jgi:membrane-bound metal-dependent hydrolase YbcI (DUF457 family)
LDSITQIVLGAAVGEAVLGKKIGNKAMLYGAIAGTIPDLDVISSFFIDTVTALEVHRGFTHSVFFCVLFAPLFAFIVTKYEAHKNLKDWSWLFFWAFITHAILDAQTTWGTQLFWPLDIRLAFKNVFVISLNCVCPNESVKFIISPNRRVSSRNSSASFLVITGGNLGSLANSCLSSSSSAFSLASPV